uniref:Uncharacterized protein n=1 Tax=Arcella intermedia TaxID=1963864 RepID=A0A6B2LHJ6_9EUKA
MLLTVHFRQRMFCKVGYVLRNEYESKELMDTYNEAQTKSTPLPPLQIDKVIRVINAEKPICTVYTIPWDDSSPDAEWNVLKEGTEKEEVPGNGEEVDEEDIDYSDEEEDLSNENEDASESISDNEMENDNDNENE